MEARTEAHTINAGDEASYTGEGSNSFPSINKLKPEKKALLRGFLGFSGRYDILGYNGSQFSQLGTMFNANLQIRF